jgi:hypothetical protein
MDQQTEAQRKSELTRNQAFATPSASDSATRMDFSRPNQAPWFARGATQPPLDSVFPQTQNKIQAQRQQEEQRQQQEAQKRAAVAQAMGGEKDKAREQMKAGVKQGAKRGILGVLDSLGIAVDSSSVGITMVVDIFMYMFTLAWLDLEMLAYYKPYLRKEPIISPLTWAPLKIPLSVTWLHIGLVALNFFVAGLVVLVMCLLALLMLAQVAPVLIATWLVASGVGFDVIKQFAQLFFGK